MGFLQKLALDRVADQLTGPLTRAIEQVLAQRTPRIERRAESLRSTFAGVPPREVAERIIGRRSHGAAIAGAVSAVPGLVPGAGTVVELGAAIADITLLTAAQVELILLLSALYGRSLEDREGRRLDVLLALGIEAGVVKLRRDGSVDILGERHSRDELAAARVDELAQRVNRRLLRQVAARLARRRAAVVLGRELPVLGVGIAAGYDLRATRRAGMAAVKLFEHLA